MHAQGSCGYGVLNKNSYPFWSVGALSLSNQFSVAGPAKACGQCFEIKCVDIGGQFAVRMPSSPWPAALSLAVGRDCRILCVSPFCNVSWRRPCPQMVCPGSQGRCSKDKNQRSVTVTITDSCPECEADHIDMQALTFNKVWRTPRTCSVSLQNCWPCDHREHAAGSLIHRGACAPADCSHGGWADQHRVPEGGVHAARAADGQHQLQLRAGRVAAHRCVGEQSHLWICLVAPATCACETPTAKSPRSCPAMLVACTPSHWYCMHHPAASHCEVLRNWSLPVHNA